MNYPISQLGGRLNFCNKVGCLISLPGVDSTNSVKVRKRHARLLIRSVRMLIFFHSLNLLSGIRDYCSIDLHCCSAQLEYDGAMQLVYWCVSVGEGGLLKLYQCKMKESLHYCLPSH